MLALDLFLNTWLSMQGFHLEKKKKKPRALRIKISTTQALAFTWGHYERSQRWTPHTMRVTCRCSHTCQQTLGTGTKAAWPWAEHGETPMSEPFSSRRCCSERITALQAKNKLRRSYALQLKDYACQRPRGPRQVCGRALGNKVFSYMCAWTYFFPERIRSACVGARERRRKRVGESSDNIKWWRLWEGSDSSVWTEACSPCPRWAWGVSVSMCERVCKAWLVLLFCVSAPRGESHMLTPHALTAVTLYPR